MNSCCYKNFYNYNRKTRKHLYFIKKIKQSFLLKILKEKLKFLEFLELKNCFSIKCFI